MVLSSGKRSKATKHLLDVPGITSDKSAAEDKKKRSRESEVERIRASRLMQDDPGRVYVILETLRVVSHNLPFRIGKYDESLLLKDISVRENMKVACNAKVICSVISDLYASTKREIESVVAASRVAGVPSLTMVCDF